MYNFFFFFFVFYRNVVPAEVSLVCVVKPDEFWDKKVTHFGFWKEKDRLGFEVNILMKKQKCAVSLKTAFCWYYSVCSALIHCAVLTQCFNSK